MYSFVGTKENLENSEDIKNACIYFQVSIFINIKY